MSMAADAHRLLVISVESAQGSRAVCVVRSVYGSARIGTLYQLPSPAEPADATVELTEIEWYGHPREVLDEMHHGKVSLAGSGAGALRAEDVLTVQEPK
ncbi:MULTISPECIES: hypothetical protein [unclassified Streptomyces]|uniref:hypothetical protein n=1 Tax=unclassified Streptomyces TaxID=2593676 RepID=UPI00202F18ED|nr:MULTISPECIES: hypothetical protein [unclassified Streptomyces]MCM1969381.1 hypothetical protein [Streptomyces sp. G1]MCX5127228.1 hypothetical protein [Streptomyces sp. NBC_00347]MCX5295339.1 hypothetical protein [Streptomyces sp. NBC_00193]